MTVFKDEIYCEDLENRCKFLSMIHYYDCTKFKNTLLRGPSFYGLYKKCPECIKESKKLYPELFV